MWRADLRGIIVDVSVENSGQGAGEHGSAVPAEHASKDQLSTSGAATPSVTRRRMPWVIALVLVILACGIGGYLWYHNHQLSSALAEQERAVAARDESVTLAQGLDEGSEEVLKDNAKLCQEFADALKQAQALTPASKEDGIDAIEDRRANIEEATAALDKARQSLENALLSATRDAYKQANSTLGTKIDELTTLIAETEGKVADNQVRVDAQTAADTAKAVKEKMVKESVSTFREATNENNESTADVQAHIDALTNARDTYQQQQSQATANTNTGSGKATTRGGNSNRAVSGNNGYVAPRGNSGRTSSGYSGGYTAPAGGGVGAGGGTSSGGINSDTTPSRDWDAILKEHETPMTEEQCKIFGVCH